MTKKLCISDGMTIHSRFSLHGRPRCLLAGGPSPFKEAMADALRVRAATPGFGRSA